MKDIPGRHFYKKTVYLPVDDCNEWSDDQIEFMEELSKTQHTLLITRDSRRMSEPELDPNTVVSQADVLNCMIESPSILERVTCVLAYGETIAVVARRLFGRGSDSSK